jgi:hypothetical protein
MQSPREPQETKNLLRTRVAGQLVDPEEPEVPKAHGSQKGSLLGVCSSVRTQERRPPLKGTAARLQTGLVLPELVEHILDRRTATPR